MRGLLSTQRMLSAHYSTLNAPCSMHYLLVAQVSGVAVPRVERIRQREYTVPLPRLCLGLGDGLLEVARGLYLHVPTTENLRAATAVNDEQLVPSLRFL